jgi:hypothetical protein
MITVPHDALTISRDEATGRNLFVAGAEPFSRSLLSATRSSRRAAVAFCWKRDRETAASLDCLEPSGPSLSGV